MALDRGDDFSDRMDQLIETALEFTAEDFEEVASSENSAEIEVWSIYFESIYSQVDFRLKFTCPPNSLATLTSAISAPGVSSELLSSELIYAPLQGLEPPNEIIEAKMADLVDALEEDDDTLRVWTTLDT